MTICCRNIGKLYVLFICFLDFQSMLVIYKETLLYIPASNTRRPAAALCPPALPSAACCLRKIVGMQAAHRVIIHQAEPPPSPPPCRGPPANTAGRRQNYQVICANCSNTAAGSRQSVMSGKHSRSPSSSHTRGLHMYNAQCSIRQAGDPEPARPPTGF